MICYHRCSSTMPGEFCHVWSVANCTWCTRSAYHCLFVCCNKCRGKRQILHDASCLGCTTFLWSRVTP